MNKTTQKNELENTYHNRLQFCKPTQGYFDNLGSTDFVMNFSYKLIYLNRRHQLVRLYKLVLIYLYKLKHNPGIMVTSQISSKKYK